jgi:hypothetical protein
LYSIISTPDEPTAGIRRRLTNAELGIIIAGDGVGAAE